MTLRMTGIMLAIGLCAGALKGALAADKNGVSPQTISLPSGPGSISGLGESFQPQLNSGSGSYAVPIQLPKGPGGFGPSLSLQYHTGNGNGCVGIGWKLSEPSFVSRNMDNGLPLYVDAANGLDDDFDGTIDNPGEIDRFSGIDLEELVSLPDATFRSESEETFLRYERTATGWSARTKSGVQHEFGSSSSARVEGGSRVFSWLLERSTDLNGNAIEYRYLSDPGSPGQKYCREIRWAGETAFYAVVMIYEGNRPDVHSDYRSGFEVRTGLRLARIDVIGQGMPAFSGAVTGDLNEDGVGDSLIRRYTLEYAAGALQLQSLLTRVTLTGADGVTALPSITFAYTEWSPPDNVSIPIGRSTGEPGVALNSEDIELIDMNRDGLPDLLQATTSSHRVHLNLGVNAAGRLEWDAVGINIADAPEVRLGSTAVHLADHSADGEADLLNKVNDSLHQCYINSGEESWASPITLGNTDGWPVWPFENPGSRTLDTDHNRMHDILATSTNGYSLWMLMPGGRYGKQVALPVLSDGTRAFGFEDPGARIADVNGDRIVDLAWIQSTRVVYWASCGRGVFDGPFFLPLTSTISAAEIARSDFADVNGDGLSDLLLVRPDLFQERIHYRLNRGQSGFDTRRTILGLPTPVAGDANRCVDVNGNGSVDLLISNSTRPSGTREQFVDFVPGIRPHLLSRVDNGLGLVTTLDYETSIQQMVRARNALQPWTSTMPISMPVVARITEDDSRGNAYTREITYRDPYYDAAKQEFRGFSRVELRELGDASAPTKITTHVFDTGVSADCRKGKLLAQEVVDDAASRFERTENTVQHRVLETAVDGRQVCFAFNEASDAYIFEQTANPAHIRTEVQYDNFGNVLHENKHGIADQDGDEVFMEKAYAYNPAIWLMDQVSRSTTRDGKGALAAEELFTYDARGNLLEQRQWLDQESRYILSLRNEYDSFGNVIRMTDANNHSRSVAYDALLHTYPVTETVHLESRNLVVTAEYHFGFGVVASSVDFAGATTVVEYDPLARQTAILRSGGAETRYTYELGAPISRTITRVLEQLGGGTFDTYVYVDGLGRALGSKTEAEDGQWRFVKAVLHNRRKTVAREWLPHYTSTSQYELPSFELPSLQWTYDIKDRVIQSLNPDGTFTRTVFEPLTETNFDENHSTLNDKPLVRRFDGLDRVRTVVEHTGDEEIITQSSWTTLGDLATNVDAHGNTQTFTYDSVRRKRAIHNPDRGLLRFEYNDGGNLIRTTDAKNQVTTYSYDFANRILEKNYLDQGGGSDDPPDEVYRYDMPSTGVDFGDGTQVTATFTQGRLVSVTDTSGGEYFSYDARGNRVWSVKRICDLLTAQDISFGTAFAYDVMDRTVELIYPDNDRCTFQYNDASQPVAVGGGSADGARLVTGVTYEATGQPTEITYGNGVTNEYIYDNRNRMQALRSNGPSGQQLLHYAYTFDSTSNILGITDLRPFSAVPEDSRRRNTQRFAYDDLDRLISVEYASDTVGEPLIGRIEYAYDKLGNILRQATPALDEAGHLDDPGLSFGDYAYAGGRFGRAGRLPGDPAGPHAVTDVGGTKSLEYDDNGSVSRLGDAHLTWDFENRLVGFASPTAVSTNDYDYANIRVTKLVERASLVQQTLYVGPHFAIRPKSAPTKYAVLDITRIAQVKGSLDPARPRLERIWLYAGWNLVSVAVESAQTVGDIFGADAQVFSRSDAEYSPVPLDDAVPFGTALWVQVPSPRVSIAKGLYRNHRDPMPLQAGQTLQPWSRLEPLTPAVHLNTSARIHAFERGQWLICDPTLPAFLTTPECQLSASSAAWIEVSAPAEVTPGATDTQDILFYESDHLGSTTLLTDTDGRLVEETSFFPFGARRNRYTSVPATAMHSHIGYAGMEPDPESDLINFGARFLIPSIGRWTACDPAGIADTLNLYEYAQNNPIRLVDGDGEKSSAFELIARVAKQSEKKQKQKEKQFDKQNKLVRRDVSVEVFLPGARLAPDIKSVKVSTVVQNANNKALPETEQEFSVSQKSLAFGTQVRFNVKSPTKLYVTIVGSNGKTVTGSATIDPAGTWSGRLTINVEVGVFGSVGESTEKTGGKSKTFTMEVTGNATVFGIGGSGSIGDATEYPDLIGETGSEEYPKYSGGLVVTTDHSRKLE